MPSTQYGNPQKHIIIAALADHHQLIFCFLYRLQEDMINHDFCVHDIQYYTLRQTIDNLQSKPSSLYIWLTKQFFVQYSQRMLLPIFFWQTSFRCFQNRTQSASSNLKRASSRQYNIYFCVYIYITTNPSSKYPIQKGQWLHHEDLAIGS